MLQTMARVLHLAHVVDGDDIDIAGRGDENIRHARHVVHGRDLVALHRRLQRADRIDLGYHDTRALPAQRHRAALAHIAIAVHHCDLAGEHHVGGPLDAVHQALAAAVEVVELRLRHRIVHVDGGRAEGAALLHLVKPEHTGRGLLRDAVDARHERRVLVVHDLGEVAAVIQDHVGAPAVGALDGPADTPVVFLLGLALPGEDGDAGFGHRGSGVVLGREDVAGAPAHLRPQRPERLDQDGGLDGHMQAAGDARARQHLGLAELSAERHQPRHLGLGDGDFLPAPIGEREVLYLAIGAVIHRAIP